MSPKVALVTGGTSGIGLSIVRALAARGMEVHFVGTNAERGQSIEAELNSRFDGSCHFVQLDLADLTAVRTFARRFSDAVPALHRLVNVAGLMLPVRTETAEGFEKTFAVGYLSAIVLSLELVGALERDGAARIANVAGLPRFVLNPDRLDPTDLAFEKDYDGMRVAIDTVHAKTVATEILAETLADRGIEVHAFHPGAVKGDVFRNMPPVKRAIFAVLNVFMTRDSKAGIYVTTSEDINGMSGQFFVGRKPSPLRFPPALKSGLWAHTEQMLARLSKEPEGRVTDGAPSLPASTASAASVIN